jgi:hypothetical protein
MKSSAWLIGFIVCFSSYFFPTTAHSACDPSETVKVQVSPKASYGESFQIGTVHDVSKVLSAFEEFDGKDFQMEANVRSVCQSKGCWMMLGSNDDEEIRVRFKDYGFFVPISLVGQDVVMAGVISRQKVSKKLLRHFKEDAGSSPEEIASVKSSAYEYTFTARGVQPL